MNKSFLCDERLAWGPWQALERAVARLLDYLDFDYVQMIGGPHDKGGDILAKRGDERWVFQVKYTQGQMIGSESIKEVLNAARFYGAQRAVVVTNAYFSSKALKSTQEYEAGGLRIDLWDKRVLSEFFSEIRTFPPEPPPLRPYQIDAINSLWNDFFNLEKNNALIVMATGLGKTYVIADFISRVFERDPEISVLVLAHVKELVLQLEKAFWPHLNKNISTHIWTGEEKPSFSEGITFATIQSIVSSLHEIKSGQYDIVVIDEAHHIGSLSYQKMLETLIPKFLIGLTATPWRLDKFNLSTMFGPPTYSISIVEGMDNGYLAEVDYRMLVDDIDWSEIEKISHKQYSIKELNSRLFLPCRDQAVIEKIKEHWNESKKPRGIIFCRTIEHAQRVTGMINAINLCNATCISSHTQKRERDIILNKFREGLINILVTVDLLNEGIDVPEVDLIIFLRVTHSRRIFIQQLGRGLRLSKCKSKVKVLDFVSDIRRIAAGIELEEEHQEFKKIHPEILSLSNSIVKFTNDKTLSFFKEWLMDIVNLQDADEKARLEFPSF